MTTSFSRFRGMVGAKKR